MGHNGIVVPLPIMSEYKTIIVSYFLDQKVYLMYGMKERRNVKYIFHKVMFA